MLTGPLILDRMEIEDVGYNPTKIATAIHSQLPSNNGFIDVETIARALDIIEVRFKPLTSFEGALLTQPERTDGVILVNSRSNAARQRFTLAHELLHFLNDKHVQTEFGFQCTQTDITLKLLKSAPGMARHQQQEAQANRFAVELLAPKSRFKPYLDQTPDLNAVTQLAQVLRMSKEATARRFVELSQIPIAVAFHRNGNLRYFNKTEDVPSLRISKGQTMPWFAPKIDNRPLSEFETVDPNDWLWHPQNVEMAAQTLYQQDGFGMTLLSFEGLDFEEEQPDIEDTFERYNRWNS